jgi:hypothetical protein
MPGSDVPVIRQPFEPGDQLPFWALGRAHEHLLFDLDEDPAEGRNLAGTSAEAGAEELLRVALASVDCPDDQLARLGLT